MLCVFEIPNCDDVFVEHVQTRFHGVTPKVGTRHERLPVSYNHHPQRPGYPFGRDSRFSPTLKRTCRRQLGKENARDTYAIVNASLREMFTRCAIAAMWCAASSLIYVWIFFVVSSTSAARLSS